MSSKYTHIRIDVASRILFWVSSVCAGVLLWSSTRGVLILALYHGFLSLLALNLLHHKRTKDGSVQTRPSRDLIFMPVASAAVVCIYLLKNFAPGPALVFLLIVSCVASIGICYETMPKVVKEGSSSNENAFRIQVCCICPILGPMLSLRL